LLERKINLVYLLGPHLLASLGGRDCGLNPKRSKSINYLLRDYPINTHATKRDAVRGGRLTESAAASVALGLMTAAVRAAICHVKFASASGAAEHARQQRFTAPD
jgi:hypothetical protein